MARTLVTIVFATFVLSACGGRPLSLTDGSTSMQDGATGTDLIPPLQGQCVIAVRVDTCCAQPMPALVQQVNQDPCLVPFPATTIPKVCADKWPKACETMDCAAMDPPSRVVKAVPGGGCVWAAECEDTNDCTLVRDERTCCACFEVYPRTLIAGDPCLTDYYVNHAPPPGCIPSCPEVKCKECGPLPGFACIQRSQPGIKVCAQVYEK